MSEDSGLVFAAVLDGNGGAQQVDWAGVRQWNPAHGHLWVHLDYDMEDSQQWLTEESGIATIDRGALLAIGPRPRCVPEPEGLMLIIRGINKNKGAEPEDMVSLRLWVEERRVITMRHRKVAATKRIRDVLLRGNGPRTTGELALTVIDRILDDIGAEVEDIDDEVDRLEDEVLAGQGSNLRHSLAHSRRRAIALRRYIAPQRDVLWHLHNERIPVLDGNLRPHLRESADRLTRKVEDLDAARDRAAVTQEELSSRLGESTNERLYLLTIVAVVFLPLGLITGLFGVNLGGIPGTDHPAAFWIMIFALIGLSGAQLWFFRRMKWL